MEHLNKKINALEKQLQWHRCIHLVSLAGIFALLFFSSTTPKTVDFFSQIKTNKIELVNKEGKTLMLIQPGEMAGTMALYNKEGKEMLYLGTDKEGNGGFIQLTNKNSKNAIQIRSNLEGSAIKMYDEQKQNILFLGEDKQHKGAALMNFSKDGKHQIIMDGNKSKIFMANPESKTGYKQLN